MEEVNIKVFTTSLRRVLYIAQIFKYELEWLKGCDLTPSFMKQDINGINNSIGRMLSDMMCKSTIETWEKVKSELNKDELHDISLLLDAIMGVANVAEITEIINEAKKELVASAEAVI